MVLKFVGRKDELDLLESRHASKRFEFVVIYGRRRIGKTYLIKRFLEDKEGIYFLCDKGGTPRNAERFKRQVAYHYNEPAMESNDFEDIFKHISKKSPDRLVIVLDEFSHLVDKDDSVPSIFQVIVDEILSSTRIFLILCGSSIGMMERGVLSEKSPLFGRKTGHVRLLPMDPWSARGFFPKATVSNAASFYCVLGGVPHYLIRFDPRHSLERNCIDTIMKRSGELYEEVDFTLRSEVREPDLYRGVLAAAASGNTRLVEIANAVGKNANDMPKYLAPLLSLGLLEREYSVTDIAQNRSRYRIVDNLVAFWFRFCEPFKSNLELGDLGVPMSFFKENINSHIGLRFENMVQRHVFPKLIRFPATRTGRFWKGDVEIDGVAIGKKKAAFMECKWSQRVDGEKVMLALDRKIDKFPWEFDRIERMVFARSFSSKVEGCFDLDDIYGWTVSPPRTQD